MLCIFCGSGDPMTAEHILPQWLREFVVAPNDEPGTYTRTTLRRGEGVDSHTHTAKPVTQTVRSVCGVCNTGWMSRLEGQTKPYLESMLRGHRRTYYRGGQTLLASWLVKTALVSGSKFTPRLPRAFFAQLLSDQQPSERTRVWLAATPERYMHTIDFRPIVVSEPGEELPTEPNAYSAVISVGEFAGFVVSWIHAEPRLVRILPRFEGALVPVWPLSSSTAEWPPHLRLDFEGLDKLADTIVSTDEVQQGVPRPNG